MYKFKTHKHLLECDDHEIVYEPELSGDEWRDEAKYTKSNFLELCGGDIDKAQLLLERLEWQHPSTLLEEDELYP